jgi:hypothetical protein
MQSRIAVFAATAAELEDCMQPSMHWYKTPDSVQWAAEDISESGGQLPMHVSSSPQVPVPTGCQSQAAAWAAQWSSVQVMQAAQSAGSVLLHGVEQLAPRHASRLVVAVCAAVEPVAMQASVQAVSPSEQQAWEHSLMPLQDHVPLPAAQSPGQVSAVSPCAASQVPSSSHTAAAQSPGQVSAVSPCAASQVPSSSHTAAAQSPGQVSVPVSSVGASLPGGPPASSRLVSAGGLEPPAPEQPAGSERRSARIPAGIARTDEPRSDMLISDSRLRAD